MAVYARMMYTTPVDMMNNLRVHTFVGGARRLEPSPIRKGLRYQDVAVQVHHVSEGFSETSRSTLKFQSLNDSLQG
jgi:hypothetical protein